MVFRQSLLNLWRKLVSIVKNPFNALTHMHDIEVQKQANWFIGQSQIRQYLRFVDR